MSSNTENLGALPFQGGVFHTTHWSLIMIAKGRDGEKAEAALNKLCGTYWPAVYTFVKGKGYNADDAQELTQEFFTRLAHKEWLNHLKHQDGKFRCFLLTFLKHFLSDERDRANAQKRGGGKPLISIDAYEAEDREFNLPAKGLSPDEAFDQRWLLSVMKEATAKLEEHYRKRGKQALFNELKDLQPGKHGEKSNAQIGAALGMTEQAVKNARKDFNDRYAELLRQEIAETISDPAELDAEMKHLMQAF